jgi:hypothetical protein
LSESLIRAQIKTILESVSGIGVVHNYVRYPRSAGDLLKIMTNTSGIVNGWTISRSTTPSKPITLGPFGLIERDHNFHISGLYEMDDTAASEITLQAICDAIFDVIKSKPTLNGTAIRHDQIQIESISFILIGQDEKTADLYHTAELSLVAYERVTKTP